MKKIVIIVITALSMTKSLSLIMEIIPTILSRKKGLIEGGELYKKALTHDFITFVFFFSLSIILLFILNKIIIREELKK